jgi:hypothetical protein
LVWERTTGCSVATEFCEIPARSHRCFVSVAAECRILHQARKVVAWVIARSERTPPVSSTVYAHTRSYMAMISSVCKDGECTSSCVDRGWIHGPHLPWFGLNDPEYVDECSGLNVFASVDAAFSRQRKRVGVARTMIQALSQSNPGGYRIIHGTTVFDDVYTCIATATAVAR